MGEVKKIIHELEREVKEFKRELKPEINDICRRFRNWRDDEIFDLFRETGKILMGKPELREQVVDYMKELTGGE